MDNDNLNNPRRPANDPTRDEIRGAGWRRDREGSGWLWPMVAVGVLLIVGLLFFTNYGDDRSNTQLGQNIENPARPGATTPPSNTAPKTTPNNAAPKTTPKQP